MNVLKRAELHEGCKAFEYQNGAAEMALSMAVTCTNKTDNIEW